MNEQINTSEGTGMGSDFSVSCKYDQILMYNPLIDTKTKRVEYK